MSQVITNPTPKQRYQTIQNAVDHHRTLVANDLFTRAIDYALLQYQAMLTANMNHDSAASVGMRMLGAHEFVAVLRNLSESATPPGKKPPTPNLDHKH